MRARAAASTAGSPPSRSTVPAEPGSRPARRRSSVVLPAPFGPSRPRISPRWSSRSTSETAVLGPYRMTIPWARNMVPGILWIEGVVEGFGVPDPLAVEPRFEARWQVPHRAQLRPRADHVGQVHDREVLHVDGGVVEELPLPFLVVDDARHRHAVEGDGLGGEHEGVGRDGERPAG